MSEQLRTAGDLVAWLKAAKEGGAGSDPLQRSRTHSFTRPGNTAAIPLNLRALRKGDPTSPASAADFYISRHQPMSMSAGPDVLASAADDCGGDAARSPPRRPVTDTARVRSASGSAQPLLRRPPAAAATAGRRAAPGGAARAPAQGAPGAARGAAAAGPQRGGYSAAAAPGVRRPPPHAAAPRCASLSQPAPLRQSGTHAVARKGHGQGISQAAINAVVGAYRTDK
eukprot:TRINITY_DN71195_c0_g1_i1.p1 TRINITY_DN71195_c0_g1~~TRINITY_DN71195_c0_g1_i1.p1  ORF type:complete len:253 (+),score=46.29 TRINITY_DN71195_c0_g1_i1:79-759(+)